MALRLVLVASLAVAAMSIVVDSNIRSVILHRTSVPSEWIKVGPAPIDRAVKFVMGYPQRNLAELEQWFWNVSTPGSADYQNFATYDQIMDLIAPPASHSNIVKTWLVQNGVRFQNIVDRRDNILVTASVPVVEKLFKTKLYLFEHAQKENVSIVRQMGEYSLPTALWPKYVDIVAGVSDFPPLRKNLHPVYTGMSPEVQQGVVPQTIAAQYHFPSNIDKSASGVALGVVEFGSGEYFSKTDLSAFGQAIGRTLTPPTSAHDHNPQPPSGVEGELDIQYVEGVSPATTAWYWTENDWVYEFGTSFSAASSKPDIVSISYGWSELAQCDIDTTDCSSLGFDSEQYVAYVNTEFMKIGSLGVSLLCASGDSGANGRTDPDCSVPQLRPAYPAASPYITAVGATQLVNPETNLNNPPPVCSTGSWSCASGGQETAVSFDQSSFTSGGGFSNYVPRPSYQAKAVDAYFSAGVKLPPDSYYNKTNRGLPDVASLGSAILIYSAQEGGIAAVGGTSASSPSFAGYMSLLNNIALTKTGKPLGFLNPLLYKMYDDDASTFRDITVGDNICTEDGCASSCQGFYCAKGWDPVTGLGVPNVQNMINYVNKMLDKKLGLAATA